MLGEDVYSPNLVELELAVELESVFVQLGWDVVLVLCQDQFGLDSQVFSLSASLGLLV